MPVSETELVAERYERRSRENRDRLYDPTNPAVLLMVQEKDRAIARWIRECGIEPVNSRRVLEVGCGTGTNLIRLMLMGFDPANMVANELLPQRAEVARRRLPDSVRVIEGDACQLELEPESFDVVLQSTVFSSILDDSFQQRLADRMWQLAGPGGGVLWYDFVYDNPRNPDVRGVGLSRIRSLFPSGSITSWRMTLAPPISRRATRINPALYPVLNSFPFLRTHLLCWIEK